MFKIDKKRPSVPFAKLFQVVTPENFVTLFNSELAQTKAFILSFSPQKSYVQKVIRILDNQESYEDNLMYKSSFIIREYLNQCQGSAFNINFVQAVEKEVESMIAGYEDFHSLRNLRKKLVFKHPQKVQIAQKLEKKTLEKEKQKFELRLNRFRPPF
jgi:hypothetical protein